MILCGSIVKCRWLVFRGLLLVFLVILWECASLCPSFGEGLSETQPLSGHLAAGYRLTYDSEETTPYHQFYQRADVSFRPFSDNSGFVFSGDLYENSGNGEDNPESVWASYGDVHGFINEAYAELGTASSFMAVKAGRQYVTRELSVQLDGVYAQALFPGRKGRIWLFGGYSADPYGDEAWDYSKVAGAGLNFALTERTRMGAEYLETHEDPEDAEKDTFRQAALSVTRLFESGKAGVSATSLDSDVDSLKLSGSFSDILGSDSAADFSYTRKFLETDRMPSSSTPYTRILGPVKPYHQATAVICKGLSQNAITLSGGFDFRSLTKTESESEFNHSYIHGFFAFDQSELFGEDLALTLQADFWQNSGAGSDSKTTLTGGGEAEYGKNGRTSFALGSFYSRYAYDYYVDIHEKTDVYTVFSRIRHRLGKSVQIKGEYTLDIYDREEHRLTLSADLDI